MVLITRLSIASLEALFFAHAVYDEKSADIIPLITLLNWFCMSSSLFIDSSICYMAYLCTCCMCWAFKFWMSFRRIRFIWNTITSTRASTQAISCTVAFPEPIVTSGLSSHPCEIGWALLLCPLVWSCLLNLMTKVGATGSLIGPILRLNRSDWPALLSKSAS